MSEIVMTKERPILMSAPMVLATLCGDKTQTRRVMKPQPHAGVRKSVFVKSGLEDGHGYEIKYPYEVGMQLWVRETWNSYEYEGATLFNYRATSIKSEGVKWKPSIFMPRAASRILLEVPKVRVEQVQDISEEDAVAEGYPAGCGMPPLDWFMDLWDSINAKREGGAYSWARNPFVWAIDFKRITAAEIDPAASE